MEKVLLLARHDGKKFTLQIKKRLQLDLLYCLYSQRIPTIKMVKDTTGRLLPLFKYKSYPKNMVRYLTIFNWTSRVRHHYVQEIYPTLLSGYSSLLISLSSTYGIIQRCISNKRKQLSIRFKYYIFFSSFGFLVMLLTNSII